MSFSPFLLLAQLERLPPTRRFRLAYSGGSDSHVLLHAMAALRDRYTASLEAVHVDHGLHPRSRAWGEHCAKVCQELGVPLEIRRLNLGPIRGESLEALARSARYEAIATLMEPGEVVLTAHHRDDQAETVLLQLLRGSGIEGLAGMPLVKAWPPGWLGRPLLAFGRSELAEYARQQGIVWVEDSSNQELDFDRNFLRQEILPKLELRWPGLGKTLSRSARHCADAKLMIDQLASQDLAAAGRCDGGLSVEVLTQLAPARCRALLRLWIRKQGFRTPSTSRLERILGEVLRAAPDRTPCVHWQGAEIRRYRDGLHLMAPLVPHEPGARIFWAPEQSQLALPSGLGRLLARDGCPGGIEPVLWSTLPLEIRFRQGGERCRGTTTGCRRDLKKLLQELGLPPWLRHRLPLVFLGDRLAAIADLWVCAEFQVPPQRQGIGIGWLDRPPGFPPPRHP